MAGKGSFSGGKSKDSKVVSWVKWDIVCLQKDQGGLGVKDIEKLNKTLIRKWSTLVATFGHFIQEKGLDVMGNGAAYMNMVFMAA